MESKPFGTHSSCVTLLIVLVIGGTLAGCDRSAVSHPPTGPGGEAIRYTFAYTSSTETTAKGEFYLSAVDAQGNSRSITTLIEPNLDPAPTLNLHIFGYSHGKLAHFIPAAIETSLRQRLPLGSPAQIQVVDLNTGETSLYQAPPEIDTGMSYDLNLTPFSPDGTKLIVPDRSNERYYVLNLDTGQSTLIPNLEGVNIGEIIGWSAADGLIYAHILGTAGGQQPVERFNPQGLSEKLNLQYLSRDKGGEYNVYDEALSPDGKELYYETITSTQAMPPADPTNPVFPEMNAIERYDIASGSSTTVVRAAPGDYFSVGAGNFTLSADGHALAYVERKPAANGAEQTGGATIWRVDLTSNSQPVKVITGLNYPFRLLWCNNSLFYYDGLYYSGSVNDTNAWYGLPITGGKPVRIAGEILGCAS